MKITQLSMFICMLFFFIFQVNILAQVELRDTIIYWQHHALTLNEDNSIDTYTTNDNNIEEVAFMEAKVIENDLIRLVILPEYGARVISFVYKPTGYEYLYQSECGSAYGINNDIFYYDWLMVYGGIFPTFPEAEHGKTWLLPWDYSVIKNNEDTVSIRMSYFDDIDFEETPDGFNNGATYLNCSVDVSVYKNSSIWDFALNISNPQANDVNYEYWTCTTLAPGSNIGDAATPLNTEIVIPVDEYFAGWSPGGWIGEYNETYDFENLNHLSKWNNMGIAYAHNFDALYWGVLNHDNNEGVFRVSENTNTKGVKLWTWGKDNVDNNLYDYSNGANDNYIELWAGVSNAFFEDAVIEANEQIQWTESYCATTNISSIDNMNNFGAVHLSWNANDVVASYELNTFHNNKNYTVELIVEGNGIEKTVSNEVINFEELGHITNISLIDMDIADGVYNLNFKLIDEENTTILTTTKVIDIVNTSSSNNTNIDNKDSFSINYLDNNSLNINMSEAGDYVCRIYTQNGQLFTSKSFSGKSTNLIFPKSGLYLITVSNNQNFYSSKSVAH